MLPWISAATVPGPYVVPAYKIDVYCALTNKVPTSPVRGGGRPEAVVTMERLMDRVAGELKLDRAEVRRRNFIQPAQMPYNVGIIFRDGRPVTYDSGDYPTAQAKALEFIDYDGFTARQAEARRHGRYIGLGLGNAKPPVSDPMKVRPRAYPPAARSRSIPARRRRGSRAKPRLAQIAADQFGCAPDDVAVVTADTAATGLGVGSFAARTAVNAGNSVHLASRQAADKIKEFAAQMMECWRATSFSKTALPRSPAPTSNAAFAKSPRGPSACPAFR